MIALTKVFLESINQAFGALYGNKLRTFLSLVGVTIGIFCIISVKTAVDSLENNVKAGLSEMGINTIYVEKYPWNEDWEDNYFKYMKRPDPQLSDYEVINQKSKLAKEACFSVYTGGKAIKYKSNSAEGLYIMGSSYEYQSIRQKNFVDGRYFTPNEYHSGTNKVILGHGSKVALFGPTINPLGKEIRFFGQSYQVIGLLEEEGESEFNFINDDNVVWISLTNARRNLNIRDGKNINKNLMVQPKAGVPSEEVKGEITGILRSHRKLRPKDTDNFSLMEMSSLNQVLENFFATMNKAGVLIGIFALFVGLFSVANIMFVSVKERTSIIGLKKAIGATKGMILLEFLIEAIVLCIIGGLVGLGLSMAVCTIISNLSDFQMVLSRKNAMVGIAISVVVGILSGIIPAYLASRLDAVVAIRQ